VTFYSNILKRILTFQILSQAAKAGTWDEEAAFPTKSALLRNAMVLRGGKPSTQAQEP
jgi:hypothetical protein